MAKRDLALDLFRSYKTGFIKKPRPQREPLSQGPGDPTLVADILENLVKDREWDSGLAEGNLFAGWASIVGGDIATHTEPISLLDGKLLVQCSSTAWATQLTLTQNDILATIRASAPGALVEAIRFIGPQAPSWKKGLRSISNGRGPRDTYG
jgi:predicted nucleic acid-binding Zn ribbon protein